MAEKMPADVMEKWFGNLQLSPEEKEKLSVCRDYNEFRALLGDERFCSFIIARCIRLADENWLLMDATRAFLKNEALPIESRIQLAWYLEGHKAPDDRPRTEALLKKTYRKTYSTSSEEAL